MRGLRGAVTALILVVAIVVIALIVVGFAFNPFGSSGSKSVNGSAGANGSKSVNGSAGAVLAVGPVYLSTKSPSANVTGGNLFLYVTINNRGPNVNITSATINGRPVGPSNIQVYTVSSGSSSATPLKGTYIPSGENQLVIAFSGVNASIVGSGPANIQLVLSNGQTVYVSAAVNG